MQEIDCIRQAHERGSVLSFESALSALTFGIGSVEKMKALDPSQLDRLRQFVIRASNAERRFAREAGR